MLLADGLASTVPVFTASDDWMLLADRLASTVAVPLAVFTAPEDVAPSILFDKFDEFVPSTGGPVATAPAPVSTGVPLSDSCEKMDGHDQKLTTRKMLQMRSYFSNSPGLRLSQFSLLLPQKPRVYSSRLMAH